MISERFVLVRKVAFPWLEKTYHRTGITPLDLLPVLGVAHVYNNVIGWHEEPDPAPAPAPMTIGASVENDPFCADYDDSADLAETERRIKAEWQAEYDREESIDQ